MAPLLHRAAIIMQRDSDETKHNFGSFLHTHRLFSIPSRCLLCLSLTFPLLSSRPLRFPCLSLTLSSLPLPFLPSRLLCFPFPPSPLLSLPFLFSSFLPLPPFTFFLSLPMRSHYRSYSSNLKVILQGQAHVINDI